MKIKNDQYNKHNEMYIVMEELGALSCNLHPNRNMERDNKIKINNIHSEDST